MRAMGLLMLPAAALAIDAVAEQALSDSASNNEQARRNSQWRCGNTAGKDGDNTRQIRPNARIVLFQQKSLDHIRVDQADIDAYVLSQQGNALFDESFYRRNRLGNETFSGLYCADYISRYLNPYSENGNAGVCVKDATVGMKWESIKEQDRLAQEAHVFFGTEYDYQQSAPKKKDPPSVDEDFNKAWGSGRSGSNPANWCKEYMKEMLCHIAFPQFAGTDAELLLQRDPPATDNFQQLVRPVSLSNCQGMMDTCNRRQPRPYKGATVPWLVGTGNDGQNALNEVEHDMDNSLYCSAWNRGLHVAVAGTGVGYGPDESEERFTADWESAAALSPLGLVAVVLAVIATLL